MNIQENLRSRDVFTGHWVLIYTRRRRKDDKGRRKDDNQSGGLPGGRGTHTLVQQQSCVHYDLTITSAASTCSAAAPFPSLILSHPI